MRLLALVISLLLSACGDENELAPFTSDGCSLFPDAAAITSQDWCSCCFEHDQAYWRGGTEAEREAADVALRECVAEKTGNDALANLMYDGVRIGGSPYFYTWYRWGYGWGYERQYQSLTREETAMADLLMADFLATSPTGVCAI